MTPDENAALTRRGYEAFNAGGLATLTELFREDAVAHQPGSSSLSGDYRGRDEVFRFFGLLAEGSGGTFRADLFPVEIGARDDGSGSSRRCSLFLR
jgi:uncharacterized protein